ncbi:SpoIIE family protein phosphatase [Streptomyces sp. NPDC013157]|uniref:SpoIIE family protein phosphatase n=1 Tax=Streptomyces sp. NPDC013157 TaxID=3364861 RepID=UPI0036A0B9FA
MPDRRWALVSLPFEAREISLPEGSLLALLTDGLFATRDRDPDKGLSDLRRALAQPRPSPEELCDSVLETLCPEPAADHVTIAFRCGFNNMGHFSTAFKQAFGVTPSSVLLQGHHSGTTPGDS